MRSFGSLIRHSRRRGRPPNGIVRRAWDSDFDDPCKAKKVLLFQQSTSMTSLRIGESSTLSAQQSITQTSGRIRSIHNTKGPQKSSPLSNNISDRTYSMEVALPDTEDAHTYFPDPSQILTEYRLLERKLKEIDQKGKSREINFDSQSSERLIWQSNQSLDFGFFDKNQKPWQAITLEEKEKQKSLITGESSIVHEAASSNLLWTKTIDKRTMRKCIQNALDDVRDGFSDLHALATRMLRSIENSVPKDPDTMYVSHQFRLEELKVVILSAWLSVTSQKIDVEQHPKIVLPYLSLTEAMYLSTKCAFDPMEEKEREYVSSLIAVQQATLFRLFRTIFIFTQPKKKSDPQVRSDALLFCSKLTCDPRLRSSQARYLARKVLSGLRMEVDTANDSIKSDRLWHGIRDMLFILIDKRAIQSPSMPKHGKIPTIHSEEMSNHITFFLLSCSRAIANCTAPTDLAQNTMLAVTKRASVKKRTFAYFSKEVDMMIADLLKGDHVDAANALYDQTPSQLRSMDSACRLLRYRGNVSLYFPLQSGFERDTRRDRGKFNKSLMIEVTSKLAQLPNDEREDCLKKLAYARFAYFADHGLAGRATDELRRLMEFEKCESQIHALVKLGEPAYIEFIRCLLTGRRWSAARDYATSLIKLETSSGVRHLDNDKGVKLLNYLLKSMLRPLQEIKSDNPSDFLLGRENQKIPSSDLNSTMKLWKRTWNILSFVKHFCQENEIMPNEETAEHFINVFRQSARKMISEKAFVILTSKDEWNWQEEGVTGIIQKIEKIAKPG